MNILFLVHIEEMFRDSFPYYDYPSRVVKIIESNQFDEIYLLCSTIESIHPQPIEELRYFNFPTIEWSWGYEPCMFDDDDEKSWVIQSYGHEYTWIPPELRTSRFDYANIFVGGGYESECLEDFVNILDHLNLKYEKVRELIY